MLRTCLVVAVEGTHASGKTTLTHALAAHYRGRGVHVACVNGFSLTNSVSDSNAVYGLFPIVSQHGVVSGNEVFGTGSDAASSRPAHRCSLGRRGAHCPRSGLALEAVADRECWAPDDRNHSIQQSHQGQRWRSIRESARERDRSCNDALG